MPSYKLIYFDGKGRAEIARLIFALAEQQYEDYRLPSGTWPTYKTKTPFGFVPILEYNGKQLSESSAIVQFLARQFGMAGSDNFEDAQANMVLQLLQDMFTKLVSLFSLPEGEKKTEMEKLFSNTIIPRFTTFEKMKTQEKKDFLVSKKVSYADVALFHIGKVFEHNRPGFLKKFTEINKLVTKVENLPQIKKWVKERPVTSF